MSVICEPEMSDCGTKDSVACGADHSKSVSSECRSKETKFCRACQEWKDLSEFTKSYSKCRGCEYFRRKETSGRPARITCEDELMRHIIFSKKDGLRNSLKKSFVPCLTSNKIIAAAYNGKCSCCGGEYNPDTDQKLVIDHCHITGRFRGWLHSKCNSMLGMARESQRYLEYGIQYLNKFDSFLKIMSEHEEEFLVQSGGKGKRPGYWRDTAKA